MKKKTAKSGTLGALLKAAVESSGDRWDESFDTNFVDFLGLERLAHEIDAADRESVRDAQAVIHGAMHDVIDQLYTFRVVFSALVDVASTLDEDGDAKVAALKQKSKAQRRT